MSFWLYQMNAENWPHEKFRNQVWEGNVVTNFAVGKIVPAGSSPQPGDMIVLFYAPTKAHDPGIYGWGIISGCDREDISFRPAPPSDYLKMNPLWNDDVKKIIDEIRGGLAMGTMWARDDEPFKRLRHQIAQHVYGGA